MEGFDDFLEKESTVKTRRITYFNDKEEIVKKDEAVSCIIEEFDENGVSINRIYGTINREEEESNERD